VTGAWVDDGQVLACAYPREQVALAALAQQGISVLVNLHEQAHGPSRLAPYGLTEVHLPVVDFTPPSPEQLEQGVAAIVQARAAGERVAVHCGGGLGRTGTLLACYLVQQGMEGEAAIDRVRAVRPGSVETAEQVAAVHAYAERRRGGAAR
jgi:atypical dual specificity phosphatase